MELRLPQHGGTRKYSYLKIGITILNMIDRSIYVVYYRVYTQDGAVQSKQAIDPNDTSLGENSTPQKHLGLADIFLFRPY
jgi:hypothetical protein